MRARYVVNTGRARRGALVLWLAIAAVVLLIFWGISRSLVTTNLRHEAAAEVEAMLAEALAESAVAEAEARIGWRVNALEEPLAELLRRPVLAAESGELDLAEDVDLPSTRALLETPTYRGFSIDGVTAKVVYQKQIDALPNEKTALIAITATASSPGLVRKAKRRLELGRRARITLTTVPRPFGNFGLFLVDGSGLTDPEQVNRGRDRALDILRQVRQAVRSLAQGAAQAPLEELLAGTFDPDGALPAPEPFALPSGAAFYGLAESRDPQKLERLDLAAVMRDLVLRAEQAQREFAAASAQPDPAALANAARQALVAAVAPLTELWTFQRNYAVLPREAGAAYDDLASQTWKLREDFFRRRAHYTLREKPGKDTSAELRALLARPVQGVIALENSTPVSLAGDVAGHVVIVAGPGGISLSGVNASGASTGAVTVVCAAGPLRVSGANAASLILADRADGPGACQLSLDGDALLRGSLVAMRLPRGALRAGELERDDRPFSGGAEPDGAEMGLGDRFFVGLSPKVHFRRMVIP